MTEIWSWLSVGLNLGAGAAHVVTMRRGLRRLKEAERGYRQDRESPRSPAGTVPAGPPGERPGGAVAPEAFGAIGDPSPSPEPVNQETLAWRGWHWEAEPDAFGGWDLALRGFNNARWDGPVLVADQVPTEENKNGIYARPMDWYKQVMDLRIYMMAPGRSHSPVQGLVALSGRVLQGEMGWRAERATIRELWIIGSPPVPALLVRSAALEDRYKCEIHWDEIPEKIFPAWHYA